MADSQRTSIQNPIQDHRRSSERLLSVDATTFNAEMRRVSKESIKRLEYMITVQEDRVKEIRHRLGRSLSQTHRLRVSMKDTLITYRRTLQQIRESAERLELSWAMLEF